MKSNSQNFLNLLSTAGVILATLIITSDLFFVPKKTAVKKDLSGYPVISQKKYSLKTPVSLKLNPISATASARDKIEVEVTINALENKIAAADLWLSYDPEVLSFSTIKPGSFFSKPQILGEKIDSSLGTIAYGIGSFEPTSGQGVIALISFTALAPHVETIETEVSLTEKTLVAALGKGAIQAEFSTPGRLIISK